jgi:NAD(P)-dependent dehydrogenase (short-subunit alcohol dehydrogenase family)
MDVAGSDGHPAPGAAAIAPSPETSPSPAVRDEPVEVAFSSFAEPINAVVIGASGGIGGALLQRLLEHARVAGVLACSRTPLEAGQAKLAHQPIELEDEASIAAAAGRAGEMFGALDLVLIATGLLHDGEALQPEKTWRALDAERLARSFRVNAIGPAIVAKHFLPLLANGRKSVLAALSARVGSIAANDLGGWHGYRAAKAALNMLLRNCAIELGRRNPTALCIGLHPGTVATGLSAPFRTSVPEGKLFAPNFAAGRLLAVIDALGPEDSGRVFAWDGAAIPF